MLVKSFIFCLVLMITLSSCAAPEPETVEVIKEVIVTQEVVVTEEVIVTEEILVTPTPMPEQKAKYVFLFIGDGMGVAQRNAAELYLAATANSGARPEDTELLMNTFPAQGMTTTYDLTSVIPDSASTATALSTGYKTISGTVGMDAGGSEAYQNISEIAKENGWKVGVISSVSIDHATPAAFYAHQASRNDYYEISVQLAESGFDYFAGGTAKRPTGNEGDQPDVFEMAETNGYTVIDTDEEFKALTPDAGKVWVINGNLQDSGAMHYDLDRTDDDIALSDYVAKGIEMLDNENGFFMAVEGGKIDWACHANDAGASILDTLEFDKSIQVAYDFYLQHPEETLIVVTGDHETGGMTIGFAGTMYDSFMDKIALQTMSFTQFTTDVIKPYQEEHDSSNANLEDLLPQIEEAFGLIVLSEDEKASLQELADAGGADASLKLHMALSDLELSEIEAAFTASLGGEEIAPSDEYTYLLYGGYDPLTMKLTTILNQKAGLAWTSYSHTGVPVQTSAIGVGQDQFNGYYDDTDIFTFMLEVCDF